MANPADLLEEKGKIRTSEGEDVHTTAAAVRQSPSSDDRTRVATYIPSPPQSASSNIARFMAALTIEQRDAVSDFIQATREPVSIAIEALKESGWDLLDAVSRFGEDPEEEDESDVDPTAPIIEPIRTYQRKPRVVRNPPPLKSLPLALRQALQNATFKNGIENPRSQKSVLLDQVSLQYSQLPTNTPSIPMFILQYDEKMWYTGFMEP